MTLGEFRKYTASLPDNIELVANLGALREKINTFDTIEDNTLDLCYKNYDEADIMGIVRAITFLRK